MPTFNNITVHILTGNNEYLREYGESKNSRRNMASSFIESTTNAAFRIYIKPHEPLVWRSQYDDVSDEYGRTRRVSIPPPPDQEDMLASLHLDGKPTPEKRAFVLLNREELYDTHEYGELIIKSRTYEQNDGRLMECGWVFNDVGIESVFRSLDVQGSGQDEQDLDLSAAMDGLTATGLENTETETTAGCIEITIHRVIRTRTSRSWRADRLDNSRVAINASERLSHTVGRSAGRETSRRTTAYYNHVDEDNPHCRFKFYYRNAEKLRKMFGKEFDPNMSTPPKKASKQSALEQAAANPLSIVKRDPNAPSAVPRSLLGDPGEGSSTKAFEQFRMLNEAGPEDDADDEKSDDESYTYGAMPVGQDQSAAEEGVSANKDDQGLGKKLGELDVRKRTAEDDEAEGSKKKQS